jgi:hypothetical protein
MIEKIKEFKVKEFEREKHIDMSKRARTIGQGRS